MKLLPLLLLTLAACTTEASLGNSGDPIAPTLPPSSLGTARWSVTFGIGSYTLANDIAFGRDGDVIVVGSSPTSDSIAGFVTARANADGAERWTVELAASTQPTAVTTDATGNIYVTGSFAGSADFGGQILASGGTIHDASELFVAKYSPTGNLLWARDLGCKVHGPGTAIAIAPDGSVVVTASFQGIGDVGACPGGLGTNWELQVGGLLLGFAADTGSLAWVREFPTWAASDLVVLANGDIVVTGNSAESGFVERFDTQHERLWSRSLGSSSPFRVALVSDQIVTVSTAQAFGSPAAMQVDALAADGAVLWHRNASGASGHAIAATPNGFVVGGEVSGASTDLGTGPVGRPLFIASYAADGEPAEARSVGTPASSNQAVRGIVASPDGSIVYSATHFTVHGTPNTELVLIDPP